MKRPAWRTASVLFASPASWRTSSALRPTAENEDARQTAIEALRERILDADADCQDHDLRIIVKTQRDLWADGVRAGHDPRRCRTWTTRRTESEDGEAAKRRKRRECDDEPDYAQKGNGDYRAGKWGRYVRAPDIYFDIMRRFGKRFVALGEIAAIRFGVKTGCDAFFMPKDMTAEHAGRA